MDAIDRPRHLVVAVGVLLDGRGRFVAAKRRDKSGNGMYAAPGGSVEVGEHPNGAAVREVLEETGLEVCDGELLGVDVNNHTEVIGDWIVVFYGFLILHSSVLKNLDSEKSDDWEWWKLANPPQPMLEPLEVWSIGCI